MRQDTGAHGADRATPHAAGHAQSSHDEMNHGEMSHGSYARFAAMLATSTALMLGLMYSMVYQFEHIRWSQTRFLMALYMGAVMTIVMLGFMLGMYTNKKRNLMIFAAAAAVFIGGYLLARSQRLVEDVAWMKAMIPHHSIALTTSNNAHLSDPRVQELAREIIESQQREIAEMEALIAELEGRD